MFFRLGKKNIGVYDTRRPASRLWYVGKRDVKDVTPKIDKGVKDFDTKDRQGGEAGNDRHATGERTPRIEVVETQVADIEMCRKEDTGVVGTVEFERLKRLNTVRCGRAGWLDGWVVGMIRRDGVYSRMDSTRRGVTRAGPFAKIYLTARR